jgi:hypothetical protein
VPAGAPELTTTSTPRSVLLFAANVCQPDGLPELAQVIVVFEPFREQLGLLATLPFQKYWADENVV